MSRRPFGFNGAVGRLLSCAAFIGFGFLGSAPAQNSGPPVTLKVGSVAPLLKVSKFLKGTPVTTFDREQLYVVEFWATWCVPCKLSIPHLTELQKEYGSKVTFVGVSIEETSQANVEPFVAKLGSRMDYTVAMDLQATPTDRRGFMSEHWMDAAGQPVIPTAFVVQGGRIAWIGSTLDIDRPLADILAHKIPSEAGSPVGQASSVEVEFPPDGGIVYGRPHVLVIFDIKGPFKSLAIKIDGREIPASVFTFCPICAGSHTVILTSDALWGSVAGRHVLTIDATNEEGSPISIAHRYRVDGSHPSLSGLSGHILMPDGFVATGGTAVAGVSASNGRTKAEGIFGSVAGGRLPTEFAGMIGANTGLSWKTQVSEHPGVWSAAGGQVLGHFYGVVSYRPEPPELELTFGLGSGDLPHGWFGASYILTDLVRRTRAKGTLGDLLAASELISLEGEVDDRGRINYGAVLQHPYGWSVGLFRVNMAPTGGWRATAAYRFAIK